MLPAFTQLKNVDFVFCPSLARPEQVGLQEDRIKRAGKFLS